MTTATNDVPTYKGAKFYKCALQVNSYTDASQYRGANGNLNEEEYNRAILTQCREQKIRIVGLADHGCVENSVGLRALLEAEGIVVFPGFEIASSEKIHMVCLYPENTKNDQLNQFLGQLMEANSIKLQDQPTCPSSLSCEQIAGMILNTQKGFWYAAHMTGKNGILKLTGSGDNYVHLWKKDDLVVAGQIPGPIKDLSIERKDLRKYREIIANKNPDYRRKKPIAIINAQDVQKPSNLATPSASCLIKMTTPTFDAFCQAFGDHESRVRLNHQVPETPYSFIQSIQWEGSGFLVQNTMHLSKHLNAVIGGRGTGKSTLIESIRYVLDLPRRSGDDKAYENFLKSNLSHSKITIRIKSKTQTGECYTISRRFGERSQVKDSQGDISSLTPKDILPDIELLGQNEILEMEKSPSAKLDLINNFLPNSEHFERDLIDIKSQLTKNRDKLICATEEIDNLEEIINQAPQIEEQLAKFKRLGIQKKLENANLCEQEQRIQQKIAEQLQAITHWVTSYDDIFELQFLEDGVIEKLPNKVLLAQVQKLFSNLKGTLDALRKQAVSHLETAQKDYAGKNTIWNENLNKIKDELNHAMSQLPDMEGKSGRQLGIEFTGFIQKLGTIERQRPQHQRQKTLIETIEAERKNLLEKYRDTAFKQSDKMRTNIKKLNEQDLQGKIKVTISPCANRQELKDFLLTLPGIGEGKIRWLDQEEIELDLVQWSQWIREKKSGAFMDMYKGFGLSQGMTDKLCQLSLSQRLELEEIELKDTVNIELNISHDDSSENYLPLEQLSTGQKCTAILNLLLINRDDPLIIDQPEDNLDNAFIADRIVCDIRQFKTQRQFLFATHNANIPVFGDAELIVVLGSKSNHGSILHQGSIDKSEVSHQAAEILEGGQAAFDMRKNKYGF